jgi:hypothetical protein
MNWFSTGYDEADELPDGSAEDRLYLKDQEEALVIFLDGSPGDAEMFGRPYGAPFCIWEYQIPTQGPQDDKVNWRCWATSTRGRKGADGEPLPDHVRDAAPDLKPYYIGFFTIVVIPKKVDFDAHLRDRAPLPDSCRVILLPAKRKLLGVLKRFTMKRNGLRGCIYTTFRDGGKAISTGNIWDFDEKLSEDDLKALLPDGRDQPHEYHTLLQPLDKAQVEALVSIRANVNKYGDDSGGNGGRRGRGRGDSGRNDRDDGGRRGRGRGRGGYDRDDDRGRYQGRGRERSRQERDGYDDGLDDDVPF